jgi:hypothetical protein
MVWNSILNLDENLPSKCLDIFLNEGIWINSELDELYLNCKFYFHSFIVNEDETDRIDIVRKFIKLNTPVTYLYLGNINVDFSQELMMNNKIMTICDDFPWVKYYLERNNELWIICHHFRNKPISQVKMNDLKFQFQ